MEKERLLKIVENLTGKEVAAYRKPESANIVDCALLDNLLYVGNPLLGWNELNELLLICNKDTISSDFFFFFFLKDKDKDKDKDTKKLSLAEIEKGVDFFSKIAMLRFGNFIYAFEILCKKDLKTIKKILGRYAKDTDEIENELKDRPAPLHEITPIDSKDTHFLGYLSAGSLTIDLKIAQVLQDICEEYERKKAEKKFCEFASQYVRENKRQYLPDELEEVIKGVEKIISEYFNVIKKSIKDFKIFINESLLELTELHKRMIQSKHVGNVNTGIYLTWDYMDVYLATSMRRKWEFETISNFANKLFKDGRLQSLHLRYFDPTQSSEESRINKGLIEGLMLKRAKCTIYSIQDTDTIGKDSELASTLAQGKPVIAYVPEIKDIDEHARNLEKQPLEFFVRKMPLLYETLEKTQVRKDCIKWSQENSGSINIETEFEEFFNKFNDSIRDHLSGRVWKSIETFWLKDEDFKKDNKQYFWIFCNFMAIADKHFYDSRAKTLKKDHPLALQVNLITGVANGVLVVRQIEKCAELLYNIILNKADFKIEVDEKNDCICLKEDISECIYRSVTRNKRLTNSFWNFYLYTREEECHYVEKNTYQ